MDKFILLICYLLGAVVGAIFFYAMAAFGWMAMLNVASGLDPQYAAQALAKEQWWSQNAYDIFKTILAVFVCLMLALFFSRSK